MSAFLVANMAPLMFATLVVFLLLGYPVAFALAALGLSFGFIGVELGLLTPALYQALPERIFGTLFFLLPIAVYMMWSSWPIFMNAWTSGEISGSAGGLIRWPARLLVPVGFFLLTLQGFSELIKRFAYLRGLIPDPVEKHEEPALELMRIDDQAAK